MTSSLYRRRELLKGTVLTSTALALGPSFWREALAGSPAQPGGGPYGPLRAADANGLRLPAGFSSRLVARGGQPVPGTSYAWHALSDGQATFAAPDGGWILVSNSEAASSGGGGASAIRFASSGAIVGAERILGGTERNCAGGATPWGTWMSCEEVDHGRVWECDPTGSTAPVVRPAMGVFKHEAVAVDPVARCIYLTEDQGDGGLYRFTPHQYPACSSGTLEIARVGSAGKVDWAAVPDPMPAPTGTPTRRQVPGSTPFRRGEGIWFDSGTVYVATTSDNRIHAYDTRTATIEVLYDAGALADPPLTGVDNVTVSRSGDLFVCEDHSSAEYDVCLITPERHVARFLTATGSSHSGSELTGVVFDPSGTRMYVASQQAFGVGAVYEVTGPFRLNRPPGGGAGGGGSGGAGGGSSPGPGAELRLMAERRVRLADFLRRGLVASVATAAPTTLSVELVAKLAARSGAKGRKAARRRVLASSKRCSPGGSVKVRLRPSRRARRLLRRRRSVSARLRVVAVDPAGGQVARTRYVRLTV